jgi:hypothetical protein
MPVASPMAADSPLSGRCPAPVRLEVDPVIDGGSRTTSVIRARLASAATRASRSPNLAPATLLPRAGRSMTSRSTARLVSSEPAIVRPSRGSAGVSTTSHSGLTPRATASTGSSAAARSSQATIKPPAWASATSRRARVVRPLETSPRTASPIPRGTPPGPRIASSSAKPVEWTWSGSLDGRSAGSCTGPKSGASRGTVASAPTVSPANPGAAAPQRERRVASAAVRSEDGTAMGPVSNRCSNESSACRPRFHQARI